MEMKKIACVTLIVAASISSVIAQILPPTSAPTSAPASAPSSDVAVSLPHMATLVGATLLSFFAYYMH
uniref:Putative arabinogalactan peptide 23-like n=1 Tax=Solanum chacoense TaxID=4108 RepID=A0A0V0H4H1_SOLCH